MSDNIVEIPVEFKKVDDKQFFKIVEERKCDHFSKGFCVDDALQTVECVACGAELSPMAVLLHFSHFEERINKKIRRSNAMLKRADEANKKLDERHRTKCNHCDKMTNIRREY